MPRSQAYNLNPTNLKTNPKSNPTNPNRICMFGQKFSPGNHSSKIYLTLSWEYGTDRRMDRPDGSQHHLVLAYHRSTLHNVTF